MANIIRRRPFGELLELRNDLDRLFDNSLRMFDLGTEDGWGLKPAVGMVETKDELVISVEIPGIKKKMLRSPWQTTGLPLQAKYLKKKI